MISNNGRNGPHHGFPGLINWETEPNENREPQISIPLRLSTYGNITKRVVVLG